MQHENILSISGLQFAENILIKTMTAAATTTAITTTAITTAITTTVGTFMRMRMGPME